MLLLLVGAVVLGLVLYGLFINRLRGLPPGPFPLPIVGNTFSYGDKVEKSLEKWKAIYGPVFTVWMPNPTIVLASSKSINEALVKNAEAYAGRPPNVESMKLLLHGNNGLAFEDNSIWKEQRRFALHALRDLGFGTARMQDLACSLSAEIVKLMKKEAGKPIEFRPYIMHGVANVIWELMFGRSVAWGEDTYDYVMELLGHPSMLLVEVNPKLKALSPLFGGVVTQLDKHNDKVLELLNSEISKVEETMDYDAPPRSYTEAFLQVIANNGGEKDSWTRLQLVMSVYDMWSAGFETTVATLRYSVHFLINRPEVQDKMQAEIDASIGTREIRKDDERLLPYCCAVLQEIQRLCYLFPINLQRFTLADTNIEGHSIPAGVDVVPEYQLVHMDPSEYERPEYFCPERFISSVGEFLKDPRVTPFSLGKRSCLGEGLARMNLFTFLTTIFQRLQIRSATKIPPTLVEIDGFMRKPAPFEIIVQERTQK